MKPPGKRLSHTGWPIEYAEAKLEALRVKLLEIRDRAK
jgi:hypothetical protein